MIHTADPSARGGHRTGTELQSELYVGYEVHLAVAVPEFKWNGNTSNPGTKGEKVPGYVLGLDVTPAGWHRGDAGLRTATMARSLVGNLTDVVCDRGYTLVRAETFRRPLHEAGINVTMDYNKVTKAKATPIVVAPPGRGPHAGRREQLVVHCGTLLHPSVPLAHQAIKGESRKDDAVRQRFDERAAVYRWAEFARRDGGKIVVSCPFCDGRAKNPDLNPATIRLGARVPYVDAPNGASKCCGGKLTIPVEQLDDYQRVPYGTSAWGESYGRRNLVESLNNVLKIHEGLERDYLFAFGLAAHQMALITLSVAHNLKLVENDVEAGEDDRGSSLDPGAIFDDLVSFRVVSVAGMAIENRHPPPTD
jgi:hypothetical protein